MGPRIGQTGPGPCPQSAAAAGEAQTPLHCACLRAGRSKEVNRMKIEKLERPIEPQSSILKGN
jgi:hypothetical protein